MHHSFRHHTYTGSPDLDPDVIHMRPFIRKSTQTKLKNYSKIPKAFLKIITVFYLTVFPGMFTGQIFLYWVKWYKRGYLWK